MTVACRRDLLQNAFSYCMVHGAWSMVHGSLISPGAHACVCERVKSFVFAPSPTLSPTDPVPRGLLTLCPEASSASRVSGPCRRRGHTRVSTRGHTSACASVCERVRMRECACEGVYICSGASVCVCERVRMPECVCEGVYGSKLASIHTLSLRAYTRSFASHTCRSPSFLPPSPCLLSPRPTKTKRMPNKTHGLPIFS